MKNLMKSASCGNPAKFMWQSKLPEGDYENTAESQEETNKLKMKKYFYENFGITEEALNELFLKYKNEDGIESMFTKIIKEIDDKGIRKLNNYLYFGITDSGEYEVMNYLTHGIELGETFKEVEGCAKSRG